MIIPLIYLFLGGQDFPILSRRRPNSKSFKFHDAFRWLESGIASSSTSVTPCHFGRPGLSQSRLLLDSLIELRLPFTSHPFCVSSQRARRHGPMLPSVELLRGATRLQNCYTAVINGSALAIRLAHSFQSLHHGISSISNFASRRPNQYRLSQSHTCRECYTKVKSLIAYGFPLDLP